MIALLLLALAGSPSWDARNGPAFQGMLVHRLGDHWQFALEGAYDGPHGVVGKVATAVYW